MGTLRRTCEIVPQPSELRFGVVRAVGRGIAVLHGGPRRARGREVLGVLFSIFTIGNAIASPTVKCFRFVCENFTTFQFSERIVQKLDSRAFWRYIRFQAQGGKSERQILLQRFVEEADAASHASHCR